MKISISFNHFSLPVSPPVSTWTSSSTSPSTSTPDSSSKNATVPLLPPAAIDPDAAAWPGEDGPVGQSTPAVPDGPADPAEGHPAAHDGGQAGPLDGRPAPDSSSASSSSGSVSVGEVSSEAPPARPSSPRSAGLTTPAVVDYGGGVSPPDAGGGSLEEEASVTASVNETDGSTGRL